MPIADTAAAAGRTAAAARESSGVLRYALRRTGTALGTVVFVVVFNFFLFRLLPGDPIGLYTRGRNVAAAQLQRLREQYNQPLAAAVPALRQQPVQLRP